MLTLKEKWNFMWGKNKLPHLKILMGFNYSGTIKWELIDAYRMGEFYWLPVLSQKIPLIPRDVINDFKNCSGMAILISPERSLFDFVRVHVGTKDIGKGKKAHKELYWIKMPEVATSEILETVKKDSEFKLLYAQSIRNIEAEKQMFMTWLNRNITLIVGIICVIALAIIIYVSVGGIGKIMKASASALSLISTCHPQGQAVSQIASNLSIF